METRHLGATDLICSALGFGTWALSTTEYGPIDVKAATGAVCQAIDAGINLIDTAEGYGPYHAESILGQALGARRNEVILVTKVGFAFSDEGKIIGRNSGRDYIVSRAQGCLERLNTDWIDLLLIHWPDHDRPFEEAVEGLEILKSAGSIRHYGVSNYTVEMMSACQRKGNLAANQVGYNLFDRRMEAEVLPFCLEKQIGFMAYGSLAYGILTGALNQESSFAEWDWRSRGMAFGLPLFKPEPFARELRVVERLKDLAAGYHKTVAQLSIAWVLSHPAVSVALVGMRDQLELRENIQAADWKLADSAKEEIDHIFEEEEVPTYQSAPQAV